MGGKNDPFKLKDTAIFVKSDWKEMDLSYVSRETYHYPLTFCTHREVVRGFLGTRSD